MRVEACCQRILSYTLPLVDEKREGICIDVGVGTFAFYCEMFAMLGFKTIAVEPLPVEGVRVLCRYDSINLIEACLSDINGIKTLYLGNLAAGCDSNYASLEPDWFGVSTETLEVQSLTLSKLLLNLNVDKVTCLKIDIEGAESTVIKTFRELPQAWLPSVVMFEYGGGAGTKKTGQHGWSPKFLSATMECLNALKECGYGFSVMVDNALDTEAKVFDLQTSNLEPDNIFYQNGGYGNIISFRRLTLPEDEVRKVCSPYYEISASNATNIIGTGDNNVAKSPGSEEAEVYKFQLHLLRQELDQHKGELQELRSQSESQLHQTHELLEQFQNQIQQAETLLQEYQIQLHQTQGELEHSQSQLHQTQGELEHSQSQLHQTQGELEHSQFQLYQTQSELQECKEELGEFQTIAEQFHEQLHQTHAVLEQSQGKLHETQTELAQTKSQLYQSQWQEERSRFQLHQTQAELGKSQSELHQIKTQLHETQLELEETHNLLRESQSQLQQLHKDKNELKRISRQFYRLQEELEQSQSQLYQNQQELEQSQSQLHQTQHELEQLKSQFSQTQVELVRTRLQNQYVTTEPQSTTATEYKLLVWDAWYAYQSGDLKKMQQCLRESLKFTPISRTESVVNWLESFAKFSSEKGHDFDSYALTNSPEWKRLIQQRVTVSKH
jgi:FkbM family methyltransferase